ncbi:MAG: hypothetical protein LQ338_006399 [Usnochroma carphineum]|nr:MAG: hypothetical protein LQ338_006399 [Usnochroma carphineum]
MPSASTTSPLILTTHAFISAFIAGTPPSETLSTYFHPNACIHEHGPTWARSRLPFLGRTFSGRSPSSSSSSSSPAPANKDGSDDETMDAYYRLLSQTLVFKPTAETLPDMDAFAVDEGKGVVSVGFGAGFQAKGTGRAWVEDVVYVVRFEDGGGGGEERRIERLDLWADPLSAWVAVGGGGGGEGGVE